MGTRKWMTMMVIGALVWMLAGCGTEPGAPSSSANQAGQTLTVGILPDVDSIPLIIAQEKGFFKEEGVTVTLKLFKSAVDRDSALQSGNLDGTVSDVLAAAFARQGGFDTVITSATTGSYKLVAGKNQGVTNLQDLKGKTVAISKNTIIEYVTDVMGTKGGLAPGDLDKVVVAQIPARLEMLQNGKIAAATLPDPLAALAVKNGAKLISSSTQMGINPGVMLFTKQAAGTKTKEIAAMYRAYNKAVDYLAKQPQGSYIDLVIAKAGFPAAVKDSLELPQYQKATVPATADVEAVIAWLRQKQLLKQNYTYQELVDDRFVK